MSSKKKTIGVLLLSLLFSLIFIGAGWMYFNKADGSNIKSAQQNEALASSSALTDTSVNDEHGENQNNAHGHDHSNDSAPSATNIGRKGTVYKKPITSLLGQRAVGDPDASITVRSFFSMSCNHCAAFHAGAFQDIRKKYIDTGKMFFIFEEFPLNGPALYGSMIARCLPTERYEGFLDLLLETQDVWAFGGDFKASLKQNAKLAGMSDEEFETCFSNKDLQKELAQNIKLSSDAWEISSTPTFVINDGERILNGVQSLETFDAIVATLTGGSVADVAPAAENTSFDDLPISLEKSNGVDTELKQELRDNIENAIEDATGLQLQ